MTIDPPPFPAHLKAVLFDMDGVLFDSMPNHAQAWAQSMTQFGLQMSTEEAYLHEGRTGADTVNILAQRYWGRNATPEEIEHIYQAKADAFNLYAEAPTMTGALEVLEQVKAAGLTIVLVTGSGQQSLLERLNRSFSGLFTPERIISSADVLHGKPHPEPYLKGLAKAGVQAHEALVVENAPLGIEAARAAEIFTIAVNTGPLPDRILYESGANLLYPSMLALSQAWPHLYPTNG